MKEKNPVYQVVRVQLVGVILTAVLACFISGSLYGFSVFWGGLTALANTGLLLWRMRPELRPTADPHQHLRRVYRSSLERFFVVIMLLAMGMLKLISMAVLVGFIIGQAALVVVPLMRGLKVK